MSLGLLAGYGDSDSGSDEDKDALIGGGDGSLQRRAVGSKDGTEQRGAQAPHDRPSKVAKALPQGTSPPLPSSNVMQRASQVSSTMSKPRQGHASRQAIHAAGTEKKKRMRLPPAGLSSLGSPLTGGPIGGGFSGASIHSSARGCDAADASKRARGPAKVQQPPRLLDTATLLVPPQVRLQRPNKHTEDTESWTRARSHGKKG